MKRLLIAVPVLLVLQISPLAQQPQASGSASLEGVVVRVGTNEPLSGARIILSQGQPAPAPAPVVGALTSSAAPVPVGASIVLSPSAPSATPTTPPTALSVTTDRDGRFVFQNLDAGLYRLQVFANGYARQNYGQRIPGGPSTTIRLAAGQAMKNVVMALVPTGNVS